MSVNSSLTPSSNLYLFLSNCLTSKAGYVSIITFTITSILFLLPLYILVLYLGYQRWRQQGSSMVSSHSDHFTYHIIANELMSVLGFTMFCFSSLTDLQKLTKPSIYLTYTNISGQIYFHILTCVERYLAVVHPVIYLSLREERGIRSRNISLGCVWLLCIGMAGLMSVDTNTVQIVFSVFTALALVIISFCSLSVLCILIRPGPGEGGGSRQQVHQSKLRAFYTITAILGVLTLRLASGIITTALLNSPLLGEMGKCGLLLSLGWYSLPSSLVLPLLFLHRAGKLPSCKNTVSGGGSE